MVSPSSDVPVETHVHEIVVLGKCSGACPVLSRPKWVLVIGDQHNDLAVHQVALREILNGVPAMTMPFIDVSTSTPDIMAKLHITFQKAVQACDYVIVVGSMSEPLKRAVEIVMSTGKIIQFDSFNYWEAYMRRMRGHVNPRATREANQMKDGKVSVTWIQAPQSDKNVLTSHSIYLGKWCTKDGRWENCRVPEDELEWLDGRYAYQLRNAAKVQ